MKIDSTTLKLYAEVSYRGLCISLLCLSGGAHGSPEENLATCCDLPSLSAVHVSRHDPSDREIARTYLELSNHGLRVTEQGHEAPLEMLQNFKTKQVWLVDKRRKVFHTLPLIEYTGNSVASPGADSSFLSTEPCADYLNAVEQPSGKWRGRGVEVFFCLDEYEDIVTIDLIDQQYGIVVYQQDTDGYIDELHDLEDRRFTSNYFTPPADYRKLEKNEFFNGAHSLDEYKD